MTVPVSELEDEIARVRDLDLSGLRARWRSVFRRKAPDHLGRHLLFRMIAYRLQADQAVGGAEPAREPGAESDQPDSRA